MLSNENHQKYVQVLKEELVSAMGCTEPIAIAYAAALARKQLGVLPQSVKIYVSGNIIKNAKSVTVPNTGGLRGIESAAAAGIVAGDADQKLKVIALVSAQQVREIQAFCQTVPCQVHCVEGEKVFDILVELAAKGHSAKVRISDYHTNVVEIWQDEALVFQKNENQNAENTLTDRCFMSVEEIIEFADTVPLEEVQAILETQIQYNTAICEEGLRGAYGAAIGQVLLRAYGTQDVKIRARAKAAAGSDARMNGCELPVVINSGSGNQGIAASVPVIEYAAELGASKEQLYRALLVSNLTTIHIKTGIGRLSAYCGAVSAGCGSGAGIAYLYGCRYDGIAHTLVNAMAIASGIVCDGAKASCAAKISIAVDAGILGYQMYCNQKEFMGGDGIVKKGVENTIANIGQLASKGMAETDREILRIMMNC